MAKTKLQYPKWYYHDDHGKKLPHGQIRPGLDPSKLNKAIGSVGTRSVAVYRIDKNKLAKTSMVKRLKELLSKAVVTTWPTCRNLTGISIKQFHALKDSKTLTLMGQGHSNGLSFAKGKAGKAIKGKAGKGKKAA